MFPFTTPLPFLPLRMFRPPSCSVPPGICLLSSVWRNLIYKVQNYFVLLVAFETCCSCLVSILLTPRSLCVLHLLASSAAPSCSCFEWSAWIVLIAQPTKRSFPILVITCLIIILGSVWIVVSGFYSRHYLCCTCKIFWITHLVLRVSMVIVHTSLLLLLFYYLYIVYSFWL
jgi:hypothetical protein